jgi:hypothetical protein
MDFFDEEYNENEEGKKVGSKWNKFRKVYEWPLGGPGDW